jgi:serine protease Do
MTNDENNSNNELKQDNKEDPKQQEQSSSEESTEQTEQEQSSPISENENIPEIKIDEPPIEKQQDQIIPKKKNPYKLAFFILGGVILLSALGFFGYKYYKNQKELAPAVVTDCLDSDTKIYDAYKDAVVLVKHEYGYFAKINGKEIQLNVEEARPETLYGTGFFVDRKGVMITNKHVLEPWSSGGEVESEIDRKKQNLHLKIASILTTDISSDNYEDFISSNWENASASENYEGEDGDYSEEDQLHGEDFVSSDVPDSANATTDIAASIPQKDYVSADEIEVYIKTIELSVALHDSDQEWIPSKVLKISDEANIDLATLQLEDEHTPDNITNVINLEKAITDDSTLKPGEKAVMIGYPLGVDFAQTETGIKVQIYNGDLSKESDGTKIQYSITSTHGASGAPVFNSCGQLIAVNFSGIDQVQGFNFGILAKHIQKVYSFLPEPVVESDGVKQ